MNVNEMFDSMSEFKGPDNGWALASKIKFDNEDKPTAEQYKQLRESWYMGYAMCFTDMLAAKEQKPEAAIAQFEIMQSQLVKYAKEHNEDMQQELEAKIKRVVAEFERRAKAGDIEGAMEIFKGLMK